MTSMTSELYPGATFVGLDTPGASIGALEISPALREAIFALNDIHDEGKQFAIGADFEAGVGYARAGEYMRDGLYLLAAEAVGLDQQLPKFNTFVDHNLTVLNPHTGLRESLSENGVTYTARYRNPIVPPEEFDVSNPAQALFEHALVLHALTTVNRRFGNTTLSIVDPVDCEGSLEVVANSNGLLRARYDFDGYYIDASFSTPTIWNQGVPDMMGGRMLTGYSSSTIYREDDRSRPRQLTYLPIPDLRS